MPVDNPNQPAPLEQHTPSNQVPTQLIPPSQSRKPFVIPAVVLVIAVIGIGGYLFAAKSSQSPQQIPSSLIPTQPTQKTGLQLPATNKKVVYSVQEDSEDEHRTLYAVGVNGGEKVKLADYQGGYTTDSPVPQVSDLGTIVYLDGRGKLSTINLQGNTKLLTEATQGYDILGSIISSNGKTVFYQEFDSGEPGQSCKSFKLWRIDTETGKKESLYSSSTNHLRPIKVSADNKKVFILSSTGEASCGGVANILQTLDLTTKAVSTIKTFRISTNHSITIELGHGILISPDEKYGVIAYSTNPAYPLISTPSKQYPVKMTVIDLSNGAEMLLTESTDRYLSPIGWYSNNKSVLYREKAPDTAQDYRNIKDVYKSIDIQSKQAKQLFTLDRRGSGMEYDRLVDDSTLVYSHRMRNNAGEPFSDTTALYRVSLDGTNRVELDKQSRFLYLSGITNK